MKRKTLKMVEVSRSGFVESTHYGVAILINSSGEILREWGNSNTLIYPRSALKPIQSLNLYRDGIAEALNLSDDFIALTTASHHAENIHQKMINNWLKKINIKENYLSCGPSWPWNIKDQFKAHIKYKVKRKIFHNCSGKHCGHLAVSLHKNLPIKNYQHKDHPIQKDLIKLIEDLSKYKIKNIGVDGCTLPNPLIPLKKFTFAIAQLADYKKLNEHSTIAKRIFDSCVKFPEITGGNKSINSILIAFVASLFLSCLKRLFNSVSLSSALTLLSIKMPRTKIPKSFFIYKGVISKVLIKKSATAFLTFLAASF